MDNAFVQIYNTTDITEVVIISCRLGYCAVKLHGMYFCPLRALALISNRKVYYDILS